MLKKLRFIFILSVFIVISYKYGHIIRNQITDLTSSFIGEFTSSIRFFADTFSAHFDQVAKIKELKQINKHLEQESLLKQSYKARLDEYLKSKQNMQDYKLELVETLNYAQISNYNRLWVRMEDFNTSKIYGLIYQGNTAGIVASHKGKPLAYMQGDSKCVYSVSIGKNELPGVAMGQGKQIHVKYIPLWMNPQVGDEVRTSGLDNIFPKSIKVGKVIKIIDEQSYQTAVVMPYTQLSSPTFFYLIR